MRVTINKMPQETVMRLHGRFDYESRRDFDKAVGAVLEEKPGQIVLSFQEVDYMDSSALGMLLVLKDKAEALGKRVVIGETHGFVKKILEVANFHKYFATK